MIFLLTSIKLGRAYKLSLKIIFKILRTMKTLHLLLSEDIWCHFGTQSFPGNMYFSSSNILTASVSGVLTFHVNVTTYGFLGIQFLEHSVDLLWRHMSFHSGKISCIISLLILPPIPPPFKLVFSGMTMSQVLKSLNKSFIPIFFVYFLPLLPGSYVLGDLKFIFAFY